MKKRILIAFAFGLVFENIDAWEFASHSQLDSALFEQNPGELDNPEDFATLEISSTKTSSGIKVSVVKLKRMSNLAHPPPASPMYLIAQSDSDFDACYLGDFDRVDGRPDEPARQALSINQISLKQKALVTFERLEIDADPKPRRLLDAWLVYPWGILPTSNPIFLDRVNASDFYGNKLKHPTVRASDTAMIVRLPGTGKDTTVSLIGQTSIIAKPGEISNKAAAAFKKGGAKGAAAVLKSEIGNGEWKIDSAHVSLMNDYGYYLEQSNQTAFAVFILTQVVEQYPKRVPAYLNLADALQKAGKPDQAKVYYAKYSELMIAAGKAAKIPARAKAK